MKAAIAFIRERRAETRGGEPIDIGINTEYIHLGEPDFDTGAWCLTGAAEPIAERLRGYGALGANHLQVRFRTRSAAEYVDQVQRFGEQVVPLLNA